MSIQVNNINKRFGEFVAWNKVSLNFPTGELTSIAGAIRLRKDHFTAHHRRVRRTRQLPAKCCWKAMTRRRAMAA